MYSKLTPPRFSRPRQPGFTLVELLVVISILALLIGISFPFLQRTVRSTSEQLAAGSLSNAVSAARAYSTRFRPFLQVEPDTLRTSADDGDGYSGAAVIITPANELRIVENDELALDDNGFRLELPRTTDDPIRNGYRHIEDLDDLRLPGRVAALGIRRTGLNTVELLPPPFAISFNRRGAMVVRDNSDELDDEEIGNLTRQRRGDGFVYYDANGDGEFEVGEGREENTDVQLTDFARGTAPTIQEEGPMNGRLEIPWERIEPVVGVVLFVPGDIPPDIVSDTTNGGQPYDADRATPYVINTQTDNNLLLWASESSRGVVVFFNRHTGADFNR